MTTIIVVFRGGYICDVPGENKYTDFLMSSLLFLTSTLVEFFLTSQSNEKSVIKGNKTLEQRKRLFKNKKSSKRTIFIV